MATVSALDRFLEPVTEACTPALARTLVYLRDDPELQAHIGVLRQKANEGTLTPEEDAESKECVEAVDVMAIMQAKACQFLATHPA